jgi:hypothetical protein
MKDRECASIQGEFSRNRKAIQMNNAHKAALALAMLMAASFPHAQERTGDPLLPVANCFTDGDFHVESRDRLAPEAGSRIVDTGRGPMRVSVADGYQMMIFRSGAAPLVNLNIERSAAGKFALNRKAIVLQMEFLAEAGKAGPQAATPALQRSTQDGVEVVALDNPASGESGVRSLIEVFDARSGTIATAYMLHQPPAAREYANDAAYKVLRDRFVAMLTRCMAQPSR